MTRRSTFASGSLVILVQCGLLLHPVVAADKQQVKIGVLAHRGQETTLKMWGPTADYLTTIIPDRHFSIVPLDFHQIGPAVGRGEVDFVLANSSIYVELEARLGVNRIATLRNLGPNGGQTLFGGVIFCRADRQDIRSLADLKGKSLLAVDETSLGGWRVAWRELKSSGLDPRRDFTRLRFANTHDAVVFAVRDGIVDAGTVRTDILERMAEEGSIDLQAFRILNRQHHADFPFLHSTRLYPEWPLAKTRRTKDELAEQVAIALLELPHDSPAARAGKNAGWTIPLDYQPVHELMRELRLEPYQDYGRLSLAAAVKNYWYWIALALAAIAFMALATVHVAGLNRRLVFSQRQMVEARDGLEQEVLARTADLKTANEELSREVAQHRSAEEALREREEIFERFMEHSPMYVFFKDKHIRALRLSRNFEVMLGKPMAELLGKRMDELFPSELAKSMVADDIRIMKEGKVVTVEEELNGRFYSTTKFPIVIDGHSRYLAGFTVDITERRQAEAERERDVAERFRLTEEKARLEDQLRQFQKVEAIGRLAGGVAHDFNNLTAIVLGYGQMLLGQLRPEDSSRKWAEQIVAAGQRSAALTRQLLAFSRRQVLQPEVLDLNDLLLNLEKMLGRLIGEDIHLRFKLAAKPGRIKADPGQIEQVVTNLVLNARDAMPLGGSLRVETAAVELDETHALSHESAIPGRYVLLTLADTGCGMDKATLGRLFEPFFTTKPKGLGTGLGLATVYGIVKQSGGYIYVCSEYGEGTTFRIYLPRTDAEPEAKSPPAAEEVPRGNGELILLVEDEVPLRQLCETILARLGYRVSAAGDSLEGLMLVREQGLEPDLVVTDVIMPGMNGAEMVERLRRDRPDLKVLYMSGYPDEAIVRHGVLDPGIPFIQKPFTERALAAKVQQALGGMAVAARPGRSVLMIDDDEQYRDLVRHFCTKQGYLFAGAGDAAAALAALARQPFDVLLVDMNIPGTDGERVLQQLRAAGCVASAIVLTGDVISADMDRLRPLGAVCALEKSSRAEPLLQAIEAAARQAPPERV